MSFFRKRSEDKLGKLLIHSGSFWRAGSTRRATPTLDDIYGWSGESDSIRTNGGTGLPVLKSRKIK